MRAGAKLLRYTLLIVIPALWVVYLVAQAPRGVDFYPLYFAAQRVLAGQSPYGPVATSVLMAQWEAPFAQAGVAYPLPLILLIVPFCLLAFPLAAWLWTLLGTGMSYACVGLPQAPDPGGPTRDRQRWMLGLLPLTFMPFHRSVVVSQATLIWFGLAVVLLWCIHRRSVWGVALCVVLLALKPQNGLLFAAYGLYWLFRHSPRGLALAGGWAGMLVGGAFLAQPQWLTGWLQQLAVYQAQVQPPSLLPWGLLALLACWKLGPQVRIAVAQVVLFPLSDVYSGLPLLLAWCAISPPLALVGSGSSWLWVGLGLPNSTPTFWGVLLIPLMAAALWQQRGRSAC